MNSTDVYPDQVLITSWSRLRGAKARPVHIRSKKSWNAASFARLRLPSTLSRHETEVFENTFKGKEFENPCIAQVNNVIGKYLQNGAFWKRLRHKNPVISLISDFPQTQIQLMTSDWCFFKILWRIVDRKHFMRFQRWNTAFSGEVRMRESGLRRCKLKVQMNQHVLTCVELATFQTDLFQKRNENRKQTKLSIAQC